MKKGILAQILVAFALASGVFSLSAYAQSAPAPVVASEAAPVSINKASAEELQTITGIGPAIAGRVIEYRQTNGEFEALEDLMDVRGIGQAKFERIKSQIKL